jgi:hypothetical protein
VVGDDDVGILARYTSAGTLDPAFDGDGIGVLEGAGAVRNLMVLDDGGLLSIGDAFFDAPGASRDIRLVRRNPDGGPDVALWGSDGTVLIDRNAQGDLGSGVAVQSDGGIVVLARSNSDPLANAPEIHETILMRLLAEPPTLSIGIAAPKLVIVDGAGASDKLVYVANDFAIDKGPGAEPAAISGRFELYYSDDPGNAASYDLPAALWRTDTDMAGRYRNATAPTGGGVRSAKVSLTGRAKVSARNLGDGPLLDLIVGGPPSSSGGLTTVLELEDLDDGITHRMCSRFATDLGSIVTYTTIADGAGRKLTARNGVPIACP